MGSSEPWQAGGAWPGLGRGGSNGARAMPSRVSDMCHRRHRTGMLPARFGHGALPTGAVTLEEPRYPPPAAAESTNPTKSGESPRGNQWPGILMGHPRVASREGCRLLALAHYPRGGEHPAPVLVPWAGGKVLAEQHQAASHLPGKGAPLSSSPGGVPQRFPILQLPQFCGPPRWSPPQPRAEPRLKASPAGTPHPRYRIHPRQHIPSWAHPGLKRIPAGRLSHKSCRDLLELTVTPMCVCFLLPPTRLLLHTTAAAR